MTTLSTRRRCPYCSSSIELGDCPTVATNFEGAGFNAVHKLKPSQIKLPSGLKPSDVLAKTGWPVIAEAPRKRAGGPASGRRERSRIEQALGAGSGGANGRSELPPLVGGDATHEDMPARACPRCEYPLPQSIDERPAVVVAMVGVNRVGKTHLLASSLTQAYRQQGLARIGCTEFTPDESTGTRFLEDYYRPLFHGGQILAMTKAEDEGVRFSPLIFNVTMQSFGRFSLIMHDVAGEILGDRKKRAVSAPYLRGARGIIFVVDPRDIDNLRDRFPAWMLEDNELGWDQGTLLSACLRPDGILDRGDPIPVAVTIAKADLLPQVSGEELPFLRPAPVPETTGAFAERIKTVSREVAGFLERQGAYNILGPAQEYERWLREAPGANGKKVTFHAVSALGSAPDSSEQLSEKVRPINCIDPLAAVLAQVGSRE
jgi:hypothetical protein